MPENDNYFPFSQRTGIAPRPPQLELGVVSAELRRLIDYYVRLEFERVSISNLQGHRYFGTSGWERVAKDFHVLFLGRSASTFNIRAEFTMLELERAVQRSDIGRLFDLIEFLARHEFCSTELKGELAGAFEQARAAYRLIDNSIVAIGSDEQGVAFEAALEAALQTGASSARSHLLEAGRSLRDGSWSSSVRESIHAVESMAVNLAPGTDTLGGALRELESNGHLHGSLKTAFGALYGYTSNEEGVRHALVFNEEARVDEADALFMLGACASFVSYLAYRKQSYESE